MTVNSNNASAGLRRRWTKITTYVVLFVATPATPFTFTRVHRLIRSQNYTNVIYRVLRNTRSVQTTGYIWSETSLNTLNLLSAQRKMQYIRSFTLHPSPHVAKSRAGKTPSAISLSKASPSVSRGLHRLQMGTIHHCATICRMSEMTQNYSIPVTDVPELN